LNQQLRTVFVSPSVVMSRNVRTFDPWSLCLRQLDKADFAAPFAECGSKIEPGLKVPKKTKK
jgi:hypothetical protein